MNQKASHAYFAEFFGTFLFLAIGFASVAVMVTSMSDINYPWMAVCWGGAVTLMVYLVGSISGAHLNPAVTITLAIWSGFDKKRVAGYIISQIAGAFCAAALVYFLFSAKIIDYEAANNLVRTETFGAGAIFATQAGAGITTLKAFFTEVVITAILMFVIYATGDEKNNNAPTGGIAAIAIGATIIFCGIAFGPVSAFAMNPARDFGPRLFLAMAGWGPMAFGVHGYGLIVPIFGPIVGAVAAGGVYTKLLHPMLAGENIRKKVEKTYANAENGREGHRKGYSESF